MTIMKLQRSALAVSAAIMTMKEVTMRMEGALMVVRGGMSRAEVG
jgi:hypothetical protein